MKHFISASILFCSSLLTTAIAVSQTANHETSAAAAPVAYVYVGTAAGVDLYDASANGKLTLAKGSPFPTSGLPIGSNGRNFISLGTYWVHSYAVNSSGAIEKQVSTINTQDYFGNGRCGTDNFGTMGLANLDHTGRNLYVLFPNENGDCTGSIQTYDISKTGVLTFDGGIMTGTNAGSGLFQAPTIIGNDSFAYAAGNFDCCGMPPEWSGYARASNGELQNLTFNLTGEDGDPFGYVPFYVAADPSNHLAAIVAYNYGEESYDPAQLASYTVDSKGNLSTRSTASTMPYPDITPWILNMSPSGKLLAVGGYGLQVFHFNGADPITRYSGVLTSAQIDQIHWDKSNHLYALSYAQTSVGLSFNGSDVSNVTITGSDGSSYPIGACGGCFGYLTVSPKVTTTYTISGTGTNGQSVSASAEVTVNAKPSSGKVAPTRNSGSQPTLSITASPTSINTFSQLFVYTATPTSIVQAPGSPYVISASGVNSLIVVPR